MEKIIAYLLGNFTLTFLILGLIASGIHLTLTSKPLNKNQIIESLFSYFLLFPLGIAFIYNFIFHVFFGEQAAHYIGWQNSPFQTEVGFASLGFGVTFILAFWQGISFRLAAVIGPSIFFLGAAVGHIYQMMVTNNFAPGNAGVIFWTDIIFPSISLIFIWLQYKYPPRKY